MTVVIDTNVVLDMTAASNPNRSHRKISSLDICRASNSSPSLTA